MSKTNMGQMMKELKKMHDILEKDKERNYKIKY